MNPIPEALAYTKVCPIISDGERQIPCCGSRCMAWIPFFIGDLRKMYGTQFTEDDNAGVCELIDRSDE